MSICPKNKSSKGRRDKRRANWKMSAPTLVKCSKCGELMMPHRVCTIKKRSFRRTKEFDSCTKKGCRRLCQQPFLQDSFCILLVDLYLEI